MVQKDIVRHMVHRVVHEDASHGAEWRVEFAGTICVEDTDPDRLGAGPHRGVSNLEFVDPFGDRVIVELMERKALRDRLRHESPIFAIDLRGRCKNHSETARFLETEYVLCPDGVGPPEGLIEIFPIPPAKLGGEVIYELGFDPFDNLFNLPVFADIAPSISFRRVMSHVTGPDFVTVLLEGRN